MKKQLVAFLTAAGMTGAMVLPHLSHAQSNIGGRVNTCVQTYIRTGFPLLDLAQRRLRLQQFHACIRQAVNQPGSSSSSSFSTSRSSSSFSSVSSSVSSSLSSSSLSSSLSSSSSSLTLTGVTILSNRFQPRNLTVRKGTTVRWTNLSNSAHTVTRSGSTIGPNSSLIFPGQQYSFLFSATGSYRYYSQVSPNMSGSVLVTQ